MTTSQNEALRQQLISAEHLDSPRDAPPGVYVAITPGGPQAGQPGQNGQPEQDGQGAPSGPGDGFSPDQLIVSPNAPEGFPDTTVLQRVLRTGEASEKTVTLGGDSYVLRTDGDSGRLVQVAVDKSESRAELRRVILALTLSGIPAIVGAVLAAWWMSRRAMRPLAEALALQRRFVADAGHELRTPLTLLSTRAQILRRTLPSSSSATEVTTGTAHAAPEPPAVRDGLDEIVADAKALTGILEDLLISADPRQDVEQAPVELVAVVDEVIASARAEATSRDLRLERSGAAPVSVSGARVSLSRLVLALVSNALDHARTRVTVTVTVHGREAWLEVADDGPGFPHGTAERAFERFASSRAAEADAEAPRHYGLGLALVAEVAHRHGGTVARWHGGTVARWRSSTPPVRAPASASASRSDPADSEPAASSPGEERSLLPAPKWE